MIAKKKKWDEIQESPDGPCHVAPGGGVVGGWRRDESLGPVPPELGFRSPHRAGPPTWDPSKLRGVGRRGPFCCFQQQS